MRDYIRELVGDFVFAAVISIILWAPILVLALTLNN